MQERRYTNPPPDVADENVTLFCPDQCKASAANGAYQPCSHLLEDGPSHGVTVLKNDYVSARPSIKRNAPVPILTLSSDRVEDNYISDYVSVPSPDSGIGMTDKW